MKKEGNVSRHSIGAAVRPRSRNAGTLAGLGEVMRR